jgi:hypothetical protein
MPAKQGWKSIDFPVINQMILKEKSSPFPELKPLLKI